MATKGSIPEFGKFGANNVGFTGVFEVKKKERQEGTDDLTFPDPEPLSPLRPVKKQEEEEATQKKCCTIL